MKLLLDTNAYTALRRGNAAIVDEVRRADAVFVSVVVVGELLYGFRAGTRFTENVRQLNAFLDSAYVEFLPVTRATADRYGFVAAALRRKGTPIPSNDIWIAAHALESGAALVSFDHHFAAIDGLLHVEPPNEG